MKYTGRSATEPWRATQRSLPAGMLALSGILCGLLSGCYPRPHDFFRRPEMSGVLVKDGVAVAGAAVRVGYIPDVGRDRCLAADRVTSTAGDGSFHIAAAEDHEWFTSLLNPPERVSQINSVCFELNGRTYLGATILSRTDHLVSYRMQCDLGTPSVEFKQNTIWPSYQWGVCRNANP